MCIFVHCRVGSLEIQQGKFTATVRVHCRVGSLERLDVRAINTASVHCRVGRLKLAKIITPEIHQTRKV